MGVLIIHHKVADFATWKPVYDGHDAIRKGAGLTKGHVFRGVDDPNMVTIILEFADRAKAEAFCRLRQSQECDEGRGGRGQARNLPDDSRGLARGPTESQAGHARRFAEARRAAKKAIDSPGIKS